MTHDSQAIRAMFEGNPHPSILFDANGRAIDCNPAALAMIEASDKESRLRDINANRYEAVPEFQPDGHRSRPFSENIRQTLEKGHSAFETNLTLSGRQVPFHVICKRAAYGASFAVVACLTDLSRIRAAEAQIRQQSRLLQVINQVAVSLTRAAPRAFDAAVRDAMDMIGRAADVDRLRIWRNYDDDDGMLWAREIYQWARDPRWERPLVKHASQTALPYWWEIMMAHKALNATAESLPPAEKAELERNDVLSIISIPIFIEDTFWGHIGFDDCTKGRTFTESDERLLQSGGNIIISALLRNERTTGLIEAREAAIASANAKSEFLSRMSHEIRTPMNAIIGMSAIAKRTRDPEKTADCLRKITTSSHQLLSIINDVLDMSKIEANRFEIHNAEFEFEKMLQNIFSVMQIKFSEKKQEFKYDIETLFTRKIISDELRLSQVLLNLLSNAGKFTPEGGTIVLKKREVRKSDTGSILRISVTDSGIGIPEKYQSRLFTSFEQANGSITRKFGGTGLGLAISKKIITLMGGDIWVESAEGRGSSFIFEIPVTWGTTLPVKRSPLRMKENLRALVVDDDASVLEYMTILLQEVSMAADTTSDPAEAAALAKKKVNAGTPYDVILVDWRLPVTSGGETVRALKHVSGNSVLIVMTYLSDWTEIELEVGEPGFLCILQKPILPSMLYAMLVRQSDKFVEPSPQAGPGTARDWTGKALLLAEDIEINREIVISILDETGVRIDIAKDGVEAVDRFRKHPDAYDLILMDMQMPHLDGISATRQIRGLGIPDAARVPIVAMTANAFREDMENCLKAGMNDYLAKPIEVDTLFDMLSKFLDAPAVRP